MIMHVASTAPMPIPALAPALRLFFEFDCMVFGLEEVGVGVDEIELEMDVESGPDVVLIKVGELEPEKDGVVNELVVD